MKLYSKCLFMSMLLFTGILLSGFSLFMLPGNVDPDRELEKIGKYFYKRLENDRMYFKFSTQTIQDDIAGEKMVTEVWSAKEKVKYANPFMTVWQDETTQVLMMKESRKVILRKAVKETKADELGSLSPGAQVDSLRKVALNISCRKLANGMGSIVIYLPLKVNGKYNPLKSIELQYVFSSGEIKSGVYEYYLPKGKKRELYEYLDLRNDLKEQPFSGTAISQVMAGTTLKKEFAKYSLVDLRGKK